MKLNEIFYREYNPTSGLLGEKEYPFESNEKSEWDNLEELADHLFCGNNDDTEIISNNNQSYITVRLRNKDKEFQFCNLREVEG